MFRRAEVRLYDIMHGTLNKFGRREAVQVLFGVGWIFYGISLCLEPPRNVPGLFQVTNFVHPYIYGGIWIASGGIAVASAAGKGRKIDRWGFAAAIFPPLLRGTISVASWVALQFGWEAGDPRGWATAIVWAVVGAVIQVVAGWPEPSVTVPTRRNFFQQDADGDGLSNKRV